MLNTVYFWLFISFSNSFQFSYFNLDVKFNIRIICKGSVFFKTKQLFQQKYDTKFSEEKIIVFVVVLFFYITFVS